MRQERLYTLVGFFIGGALILTLLTAIFLYDVYLHKKIETYVMFFKGSLKGLETSSTVTYRGVKIGEVKRIEITENISNNKIDIPVYVQFFVEKKIGLHQNPVQLLINNGYVANITKPNFLSGIADIELIQSTLKQKFIPAKYHGYPIFPTKNKAEEYTTLDETLKAAKKAFEDISEFVNSKEIRETIDSAGAMADSFYKLANNIDQNLPTVVAYLNQSLKQISSAAYSTQNLTDYLSRYPESLLRGKK